MTALLEDLAAGSGGLAPEPLPLLPVSVVGRFEILRELGRGGFGVVYEARDQDLWRHGALKFVRPGRLAEEERKVTREAEAIAQGAFLVEGDVAGRIRRPRPRPCRWQVRPRPRRSRAERWSAIPGS